jgi:hypothetical protein
MSECVPGDPAIEVTIGYGDETLVLTPDCVDAPGLWWSILVPPLFAYRYTSAPPSAWVPGDVLLAVVEDVGTLNMTVGAIGSTTAELEAQKALLDTALATWPWTLTITITDPDTSVTTEGPWEAHPTVPNWGDLDPLWVGTYAAEAVIVATLNPVGSP